MASSFYDDADEDEEEEDEALLPVNNNTRKRKQPSSSTSNNDLPPFYCCYLLTSLNEKYQNHTYIGFTVHPQRRIRQHNGEIEGGAKKTQRKRPWEMVLCVHGFTSKKAALLFEWCWQHPLEARATRDAMSRLKGQRIGNFYFLRAKIRFVKLRCVQIVLLKMKMIFD